MQFALFACVACVDYVDCVDCVDCVGCVDCVDCRLRRLRRLRMKRAYRVLVSLRYIMPFIHIIFLVLMNKFCWSNGAIRCLLLFILFLLLEL